jgi:arylsulfatase A-like enzyme
MDVVTGTKPGTAVVLMADPAAGGHWLFNPHGRDTSAMPSAWDEVTDRFGPPPAVAIPLLDHIAYLGQVFADHVLAVRDPDVALLWLAEPDTSLHYRGTHHADTHAALRAADAAVARALAAIEASGRANRTAVLVFSDHGQISCPEQVDLPEAWASLGLVREAAMAPEAGAVLVRGRCGGITLLPATDAAPRRPAAEVGGWADGAARAWHAVQPRRRGGGAGHPAACAARFRPSARTGSALCTGRCRRE